MPQFPLGTVLLPTAMLPLQIFEPRYLQLIEDLESADHPAASFGVVLIERGSEVGGGEVRRDHGVLANPVEIHRAGDDRAFVLAIGGERFRVVDWLDDSPYPRAGIEIVPDIDDLDETVESGAALGAEVAEHFWSCRRALQRHGVEIGPDPELLEDPGLRTYQMAQASPLGEHDRYQLVAESSVATRMRLLLDQLVDAEAMIDFRFGNR